MEHTLLLNATFEPISIVDWQRAMTLICQGKAEVIEEHERVARAVTFTFRIPSIVRLLRFVRLRKRQAHVPFTRANIYARDNYTCQYCRQQDKTGRDLTFDHVIPAAQGGPKNWENIVTCCVECNRRKGAQTPAQARMTLIRKPQKPGAAIRVVVGLAKAPKSWLDYLYWNVELEAE